MFDFCRNCWRILWEFVNRIRLAITIIIWGQLSNGALQHLETMKAELDWIATHHQDLDKQEIVLLIIGDVKRPQTGLRHHLAHALNADIWRQLNAQMIESEVIHLRQQARERIKKSIGK